MFTPGPWKQWETETYCQIMAPKNTAYRIADVHSYATSTNGPNRDQRNANARLIAAAPEMYELLKRWESEIARNDDGAYASEWLEIKSLIERIEGK